ncbi:MAG: hypothetical protein MJ229_05675 [bacterium]|nr:hypothetical protein [bacterium]
MVVNQTPNGKQDVDFKVVPPSNEEKLKPTATATEKQPQQEKPFDLKKIKEDSETLLKLIPESEEKKNLGRYIDFLNDVIKDPKKIDIDKVLKMCKEAREAGEKYLENIEKPKEDKK